MKTINWGIIGCGDVTEKKSGPAFNLVPGSKIVAVMRRNGDKARDYAKRHGIEKWYDKAEDLISDDNVNAVYVATPPDTHAKYAIKAMKAGKPVYVEKPMALNYEQCQEMIKTSEETKQPLFVAYYRRALPGFLKVKELIESNKIGKVRNINIILNKSIQSAEFDKNTLPWRVKPEIGGAGHFYDLASHQLDYLDFLFGPIKEVNGSAINQAGLYKAEDLVTAIFKFENNIVCTGSWCFTVSNENEKDIIEINGEAGTIIFSYFDFVPVKLQNKNGVQEFDYPYPPHVQLGLIKQVVSALQNNTSCVSTGISGSRTSWVMEEVVKNYYKNKI